MSQVQVAPVADTRYNVVCESCGRVFTPPVRSALWWKVKQRADRGFLDAHPCTSAECGCRVAKVQINPNAPFRVFGYTSDLRDFDIPCETFAEAVKHYRNLRHEVVFISGISVRVRLSIDMGDFARQLN